MKGKLIMAFIVIGTILIGPHYCIAEQRAINEDSRELQFQDLLMVYLNEKIDKDVNHYYEKYLKVPVSVYPYQVEFINIERLNGFRGYDFKVVLDVIPVVGPHISVGEDQLTYEISYGIPRNAKLLNFKHLKNHTVPPHWQHIIRKP